MDTNLLTNRLKDYLTQKGRDVSSFVQQNPTPAGFLGRQLQQRTPQPISNFIQKNPSPINFFQQKYSPIQTFKQNIQKEGDFFGNLSTGLYTPQEYIKLPVVKYDEKSHILTQLKPGIKGQAPKSIPVKNLFKGDKEGGVARNELANKIEEVLGGTFFATGPTAGLRMTGKVGMSPKIAAKTGAIFSGIQAGLTKLRGEEVKPEDLATSFATGAFLGFIDPAPLKGISLNELGMARKRLGKYGFTINDNPATLKSNFIKTAFKLHPDQGGNQAEFVQFMKDFESVTSAKAPSFKLPDIKQWASDLWKKATTKPSTEKVPLRLRSQVPAQGTQPATNLFGEQIISPKVKPTQSSMLPITGTGSVPGTELLRLAQAKKSFQPVKGIEGTPLAASLEQAGMQANMTIPTATPPPVTNYGDKGWDLTTKSINQFIPDVKKGYTITNDKIVFNTTSPNQNSFSITKQAVNDTYDIYKQATGIIKNIKPGDTIQAIKYGTPETVVVKRVNMTRGGNPKVSSIMGEVTYPQGNKQTLLYNPTEIMVNGVPFDNVSRVVKAIVSYNHLSTYDQSYIDEVFKAFGKDSSDIVITGATVPETKAVTQPSLALPVPNITPTTSAMQTGGLEPLAQEARTFYHGTSSPNEIIKEGFKGNRGSKDMPLGYSLTSDINVAQGYRGGNASVLKVILRPDAKVVTLPLEYANNVQDFIDIAKKQGYDAVDIRNATETAFKNQSEIRLLNPKAVENITQATKEVGQTGGIKVYHYSGQKIENFNDIPTGTWFTNNDVGYNRKPNAGIKNEVTIPNNLNLANKKQATELGLYQGNQEQFVVNLKSQGFDGVKMNVDGDTHYLIVDKNNIVSPLSGEVGGVEGVSQAERIPLKLPPIQSDAQLIQEAFLSGDEAAARNLYDTFQGESKKLPPFVDLVNQSIKQSVGQVINSVLTDGEVAGKALYDSINSRFPNQVLPDFDYINNTLVKETIGLAEEAVTIEAKREVQKGSIVNVPSIFQYKATIQAAVRLWNLTKARGKEDLATLTNRLATNRKYAGASSLDSALDTIRSMGIDIKTPEGLAAFAQQFKKPTFTPEQAISAMSELDNPTSPTRVAFRNYFVSQLTPEYLNMIGKVKMGGSKGIQPDSGQLSTTGEIYQPTKIIPEGGPVPYNVNQQTVEGVTAYPPVGKISGPRKIGLGDISKGQKIAPDTGVIPPDIFNRIVEQQIRRINELRRRAKLSTTQLGEVTRKIKLESVPTQTLSLAQEQLQKTINEKKTKGLPIDTEIAQWNANASELSKRTPVIPGVVGQELGGAVKPEAFTTSISKTQATYEERKSLIEHLQPAAQTKIKEILSAVEVTTREQRLQAVKEAFNQIKTSSPLENQFNAIKGFTSDLLEITNLIHQSEAWPSLAGIKPNRLASVLMSYVREPYAARLAGNEVSLGLHAPFLYINNIAENIGRKFTESLTNINSTLTEEESKVSQLLANGFSGRTIKTILKRLPTEKEKQVAGYLRDFYDSEFVLQNAIRRMGGLRPLNRKKDYSPWVIDRKLAAAAGINERTQPNLPRLSSKKTYLSGFFTFDLRQIAETRGSYLTDLTRKGLARAFLKTAMEEAGKVGGAPAEFARLMQQSDILGSTGGASKGWSDTIGGIDQKINDLIFPQKVPINAELQQVIKESSLYNSGSEKFKKTIDEGYFIAPHELLKIPKVAGAVKTVIYANTLGFGNILFTLVNLQQPILGIPFAGGGNLLKAYADYGKTIFGLNPTGKEMVQIIFKEKNIMSFGGEDILVPKDYLHNAINTTKQFVFADLVLSENVNRNANFFQKMNDLAAIQKDIGPISSTPEWDMQRNAAAFTGYINVLSGRGNSPFASRGILSPFYMFNQFPLQAIDIMDRMFRINLDPREKSYFEQFLSISGGGTKESVQKWQENYEKLNPKSKSRIAQYAFAIFATLGALYQITGSWDIIKRYIPGKSYAPNVQTPTIQILQAMGKVASGDVEGGFGDLKKLWERIFPPAQIQRLIKAYEGYTGSGIPMESGKDRYTVEKGNLGQAIRIGIGGVTTIPSRLGPGQTQSEINRQLYDLKQQGLKRSDQENKLATQIFSETEKIGNNGGSLEDQQNHLRDTLFSNRVPADNRENVIDKIKTLQEENLNRIGSAERSLKTEQIPEKIGFIKRQMLDMKTQQEKDNYLIKLENQGIISPEVKKEWANYGPTPEGFLGSIKNQLGSLLGVRSPEAQANLPLAPLAGELRQAPGTIPMSDSVLQKQQRSQDFSDAGTDYKNSQGQIDFGYVSGNIQSKYNITPEELQYDLKTKLSGNLQNQQIKNEIQGLTGNDLLNSLTAMRYVSQGSRAPLLTNGIINDFVDERIITDSQGDYLKSITWNEEESKFKWNGTGSFAPKKPKKIKFTFPKAKEPPKLKLNLPKNIKPLTFKTKISPIRQTSLLSTKKMSKPPRISIKAEKPNISSRVSLYNLGKIA